MSFLTEYPFDTQLKRMTVTYFDEKTGTKVHYAKGALERVSEICTHYAVDEHNSAPIDEKFTKTAEDVMLSMAGNGMRVLTLAVRRETEPPKTLKIPDDNVRVSQSSVHSFKEQVL